MAPQFATFRNTVIALISLMAVPALADAIDHSEARALRESGSILSLEAIIEKAKMLRQGEVIDTELERDKAMLSYEVEILDDEGRVWELEFDAANGELIELELDD